MTDLAYGHEYVDDEWPYGLRCAECDKLLGEGDRWASKLTGFVDQIPCVLIICLECALTGKDE